MRTIRLSWRDYEIEMSRTKRNPDSVNKQLKLGLFGKKAISNHINSFISRLHSAGGRVVAEGRPEDIANLLINSLPQNSSG